MKIMHPCFLLRKNRKLLLKEHLQISYFAKNMFETNVPISITKKNSKISTHVALFIINMNICPNFESEWSTFYMQK
jgi:hypothetical protein